MRHLWLPLLASLLVSACGYHLRGHVETQAVKAAPRAWYIAASSPIGEQLRLTLQSGGARIVQDPKAADARLSVSDQSFDRRVLSVDPGSGKVREYELAYAVAYGLEDRDGETLLKPRTLRLTRDYVFNEAAVLGSDQEEEVLRQDLVRAAAQGILRRAFRRLEAAER